MLETEVHISLGFKFFFVRQNNEAEKTLMKKEKLIIRVIICLILGIIFLSPIKGACSNSAPPNPPPGGGILATSPPVPVGSGARAQGMGSAFIAVADDATAASWNPGGLGQLQKPEISIVGRYFSRDETYNNVVNQGSCEISSFDLNYLSAAYAKNLWERNVFFSLNYQKMFDFGRKLKDLDCLDMQVIQRYDFQQEGSLYAFSPAMAIEFMPGLYIGVTYNIWSDHITGKSQWKGKIINTWIEDGTYAKTNYNFKNFRGDNYTLGFLWRVTPRINIGGVYKKSFRARVTYEYDIQGWQEGEVPYEINFPTAYGVGVSFRIGDSWTVAGDITRTEWQDYRIFDPNGVAVGPFGQHVLNSDKNPLYLDVPSMNSTYTMRLGVEYARIMGKIILPFRFGLYYDPEPSVGSPQDYYGGSLGFGIVMKNRLALDFAYQYRFADNVNGNELGVSGTTAKIRQHSMLSSLIFYF